MRERNLSKTKISNKGKKKTKGLNRICLWLSKIFLTATQIFKIFIIITVSGSSTYT